MLENREWGDDTRHKREKDFRVLNIIDREKEISVQKKKKVFWFIQLFITITGKKHSGLFHWFKMILRVMIKERIRWKWPYVIRNNNFAKSDIKMGRHGANNKLVIRYKIKSSVEYTKSGFRGIGRIFEQQK